MTQTDNSTFLALNADTPIVKTKVECKIQNSKLNNLAPIVLFVYNRPDHTKQTVEALQKNELAKESELFIYSDEAKNEEARKSVDEVRTFIDAVDGFKKVTVISDKTRALGWEPKVELQEYIEECKKSDWR